MRLRSIVPSLALLAASSVQAEPQAPAAMKCETGPVHRQFGGTDWLVYSCDDGRSMVAISSSGNPASPFYFILTPKDGSYGVFGEGTGSKAASDAAGADLSRLRPDELAALLAETKTASAAQQQ